MNNSGMAKTRYVPAGADSVQVMAAGPEGKTIEVTDSGYATDDPHEVAALEHQVTQGVIEHAKTSTSSSSSSSGGKS